MTRCSGQKWGFLRETAQKAKDAGHDKATGLHRTGLDEYLSVIFPDIDDWIHNRQTGIVVNEKKIRYRPDYRSDKLKLIIEFDGIQHYTQPEKIKADIEKDKIYKNAGYKVVRIPFFIQLTNDAVKTLFDVEVSEKLFDVNIPSLSIEGKNTPAYLCPAGAKRMKTEFKKFPEQLAVNKNFLEEQNDVLLSGVDFL